MITYKAAAALGAALAVASPAVAADKVVNAGGAIDGALSQRAIANAKPYVNPLPAPSDNAVKPDSGASGAPGASGAVQSPDAPRAFGSFGIPYTSTRVVAGPSSYASTVGGNYLSTTYPYRAVGRLTFTTPFGSSWCSASVIRTGIIVTAAHCIQRFGGGATLYSAFTFTPGYYAAAGATATQIAPYGSWSWRALVRPGVWANGTDIGSGAARDNDLAVIALHPNARGRLIGQVVGQLGYGWNNPSFPSSPKTGNLRVGAVTTLGYPGLMDSGRIMQRADGPTYLTTVGGSGQLWQGNNFTGGSSGGPWVVNFVTANPALSGGAVIGADSGRWVIGVTSWGSADPNAPKDNYSSQFRQNTRYPAADYGGRGAGNIASLLTTLCNAVATGGTLTYAQLGYCN